MDCTELLESLGASVDADVQGFVAFVLEKEFSPAGEAALVDFFVRARKSDPKPGVVLTEIKLQWARNYWSFQDPVLRGDPYAPGTPGKQNRGAISDLYNLFGIKCPL